jgi:hypothetical protein
MKRFLATLALTFTLFSSALAGDIPSVGAPSPVQASGTSLGDISSGGKSELSGDALNALLSVLSFLAV